MFRQTDDFPSFLSSPRHSPSKSTPKHPLLQLITSLSKDQHATFATLSQKCSALEYSIANIEVYAARLADRAQTLTESRESEMLGGLKMKQYEFIIGELKSGAAKQSKKEERLTEQLEGEKRKAEKLREENYRLEAKQTALLEKIARLEAQAKEKGQERESQRLRTDESERVRSKSKVQLQTSGSVICTEEYRQLQGKLEELEKEFTQEVEKLVAKNNQLASDLRRSQQETEELRASARVWKKETDQLKIGRYELELKLKQQTTISSELEESYNRLIEKTNASEILLHRQIQDSKTKETDLRNEFKRQKRSFRTLLSSIAECVNNNSKYYLTAHSPEAQLEEIKKLHEKNVKKKVENAAREVEFYRNESSKYKTKLEVSEARVLELERNERNQKMEQSERKGKGKEVKQEAGSEREIDKIEGSEGGSFMNPAGSEKSEQEKYRNVQEKYKSKLQTLRKDVKAKQAKINELQKLQQTEFDRSKEKILELELAISEKGNDLRKAELKMRQKDYEIQQLKNATKELQGKVAFLNDKMETEKEAANKLADMKAQSYEEKLKTIRATCKEVQRREQQKTVKYNKLKTKLQKYELQASESLKRKNQQIEQLLRDNSKAKAENQLLEQKLNISQIIENETAKTKTPHPVNQDLIDQIQMESDRVAAALTEQHARNQQLADNNLQISNDLMAVRREAIELRVRIEQLTRSERVLMEECRFAKEKIEELTRAGEESREQKHSYFKKELEKAVVAAKKMQKQMAERDNAKRQMEKQLEEVTSELTPLRNNYEKLKDKNIKLSDEVLDQKEAHKKAVVDYERKLSECNTKIQQLITIIQYKNREGPELRESMKGEELLIEQEAKIKVDQQTNTPVSQTHDTASNTDPIDPHPLPQRKIIPSELILDQQCFEIGDLRQHSKQKNKSQEIVNKQQKVINYFGDLVLNTQNMQEHFQICEEGEEMNIGVSSLNLQIKEIFNALRKEIEKIFNQEDISLSLMKLLPRSLEDDFNQFIAYIKQKIDQIKKENNLSFIMAEGGNEPSFHPIETQLAEFLATPSHEHLQLRKIIEQKEILITSLMNEKTEQQNTINQLTVQKQEVEEENENRFMNQCNIYKREIKEHKKTVDLLEMNCQSLRNIFRNLVDIWLEPSDNEDDLKDNLVLYANITKLNEQDKKKLALFLQKYREAHPR